MITATRKTIFSSILFLFCLKGISQAPGWPKTLLWQITRADLDKPSFLFGTMHLQDKRVFNLGDSFYHHFERAEGFAIEVDFNEYMDSLLRKSFEQVEESKLKSEEDEEITETRIDTTVDTATAIHPPPEINSKTFKKYFRKLRNERIRRLLVHGEMPTILDAYLYGMAMKQGKWLGAVEDVKDQLNLRDEIGKDLDDEELNQSEDKMMFTLETMIKTYLGQDLNKIEDYVNHYGSARAKTKMFHNRNLKMTRSIDSLSHQRSMFYAVGAAHLPGDSGVIRLLRDRGYTVTPVFSKTTIAAEKYAEKLPSLSWYEVGQTDSLYSIDMPGIPAEYNMFGELVKMKVFVDITTMTFYMTGHSIARYDDDKLEAALKNMAESMNGTGKVENIKKVDREGVKGIEGIVSSRGANFRIQILKKNNTAFILMMGGEKRNILLTTDANKFFSSFRAGNGIAAEKPKDWKEFKMAEKAFTVMMPDLPKRNKSFEKQAEGSGWNFSVFDCTDLSAGLYYVMQIRDINAGMFLDGDSAYFSQFKENLLTQGVSKVTDEVSTFAGFPSLRFDGISEKDNLFYKTFNVARGNRVYTMLVLGHESKKDDPGPDQFFRSLHLINYEPAKWEMHHSDDHSFSGWTPTTFKLEKKDGDTDSSRLHYTSYNANEAISYEVIKDFLPEFYWAENDSVFYKQKADATKAFDDSVLSYKKIRNGNLAGVELLIRSGGSNNLQKKRMFLHGDTLYTLLSFIPSQYIDNPNHIDFFTKFRVTGDGKNLSTVYTSKAGKLLKELLSKDSATLENASTALNSAPFQKADLPLLHDALMQSYPDDTLLYGSVKNKLINSLDGISDSSTVDFIKANYDKLGDRGGDKIALLNILANQKTTYSYKLLKELFTNRTPEHPGTRNSIGYRVTDSLELTKILYPELLNLIGKPDYWQDISDYTSELLDSNMLDISVLGPHQKVIEHIADTLLAGNALTDENAWVWQYESLLRILGHLNTNSSNSLLQRYIAQPGLDLKKTAVLCLLKNTQAVDAKEIEKIAASNEHRTDLYNEFKEIKKESFFPSRYKTQRYFAEAEIYSFGDEDYSPSSVELIGERESLFNGEKKRFFLFRLGYAGEEEKETESYLGLVGPYSLDTKDIETNGDATEIYFDEQYNKKQVDKLFKEMIRKGEEFARKKGEK